MTEEFAHPETGEVLSTREDFNAALADIEERMAPLYKVRRQIRENAAKRFNAPDMPAPRYRTQAQERVARCPRCGGTSAEEDLGA